MKSLVLALLLSVSLASVGALAKSKGGGKKGTPERGERGGTVNCPSYGCDDGEGGRGNGGGGPDDVDDGSGGRGDGGGGFDGGGYGGGGGMIGEIFYAPEAQRGSKTYPVTSHVTKEDRGDVVVITTIVQEDISADETCTTKVVTVVDKASGKTLSSTSKTFCNVFPM
ncbi:hypothetical protein D3C87_241220 [compost metagenome]